MSEFKIGQREVENVNILELKGYLDAHTAPKLEEAFQNLLKSQRFRIVVNCRDLSYISSAGLGVFMAFIEDVRNAFRCRVSRNFTLQSSESFFS